MVSRAAAPGAEEENSVVGGALLRLRARRGRAGGEPVMTAEDRRGVDGEPAGSMRGLAASPREIGAEPMTGRRAGGGRPRRGPDPGPARGRFGEGCEAGEAAGRDPAARSPDMGGVGINPVFFLVAGLRKWRLL
ncbi:hypothetical protein GCM10018953_71570 [Streptosporangium nondiastaticum]